MENETNTQKNETLEEEIIEQEEITSTNNEEVEDDQIKEEKLVNIEELEMKLEESENRLLRLQADFENFRRRTRIEREAAEKYRAQQLVTDILPVLDNFERALNVETDDEKSKSILQGMEMVYRQLLDALKNEGLETIEAVGNEFDPHLHQAVMQVQEDGYDSNVVIEEFQKGYKLKDRVIRPSMVKVNG